MPFRLYIKDSTTALGTLTEDQLQQLVDLLEEESATDRDYFIDRGVLEYLEREGADPTVLGMLRPHVGDDGLEIVWKEEP